MNAAHVPNPPRFTPQGLIPTDEQRAIQLAQNKVVLIDANAGAAKTTTLALRIGEALARKLAPEHILALTFTPEARDVLRYRLLDLGIQPALVERVAILTFEDFAAWQLAPLDVDTVRQCRDSWELKEYALHAIDRAGERYAGRLDGLELHTHSIAISQFLDAQLHLKASMALDADVEFLSLEEAAELMKVPLTDYVTTLEYEALRLDGGAGALFRGPFDATYDLACNLHGMAQLAAQFPDYRLVLCDELHDLNEAAFRILDALISRPPCFFVGAGDKDQVIHARLGASDEFLRHRFSDRYPKLARYPLTATWRHGPHLAYAMAEFKQKTAESALPVVTDIPQAHYASAADCAQRVVDAIQRWREVGKDDSCAVLVRDTHQSIAIENALLRADIAYRTAPMASYLQRDEILFLRGLLAIALMDFKAIKSKRVKLAVVDALVAFSEMPFSAQRVDHFKRQILSSPDMLGELFRIEDERRDDEPPGYREVAAQATRQAVLEALSWLARQDATQPAAAVLRELCQRTNLVATARRVFMRPYQVSVIEKSVAGLIAHAAYTQRNLRDFWLAMNRHEERLLRARNEKAVLIECVANAKGQEFDHVIMPFLQADEFPHPLAARRDEENLFYVGATRARMRLTLLSPSAPAQRSSFIERMGLAKSAPAADHAIRRNDARVKAQAGAAPARHYLNAGFSEKEKVKALGAKFDVARRAWYVDADADLSLFITWLKK